MDRLDSNLLTVLRPFIAARAEHFKDPVAIRLQADEPGKFKLPKINRLAAVCAVIFARPEYGGNGARFCEVDLSDPQVDQNKAREIRAEIVEVLDDLWEPILSQQAEKLFTEGSR